MSMISNMSAEEMQETLQSFLSSMQNPDTLQLLQNRIARSSESEAHQHQEAPIRAEASSAVSEPPKSSSNPLNQLDDEEKEARRIANAIDYSTILSEADPLPPSRSSLSPRNANSNGPPLLNPLHPLHLHPHRSLAFISTATFSPLPIPLKSTSIPASTTTARTQTSPATRSPSYFCSAAATSTANASSPSSVSSTSCVADRSPASPISRSRRLFSPSRCFACSCCCCSGDGPARKSFWRCAASRRSSPRRTSFDGFSF